MIIIAQFELFLSSVSKNQQQQNTHGKKLKQTSIQFLFLFT